VTVSPCRQYCAESHARGSVLGPVLFLLFTADLLRLIRRYIVSYHTYADDIQFCSSCLPAEVDQLSDQMSASVEEVISWVTSNRLQLNPLKSQVLWCSSIKLNYT